MDPYTAASAGTTRETGPVAALICIAYALAVMLLA
jgi:hypothetical protein